MDDRERPHVRYSEKEGWYRANQRSRINKTQSRMAWL
jgi:hypothetical protein